MRWLLLAKDFIRYQLTGRVLTDFSDASGTLLFNTTERRWSEQILSRFDISPDLLPQLVNSADFAGEVLPGASKATGLHEGTPVYVGSSDICAAVLGSGPDSRATAVVSLGSAGQVVALRQTPTMDAEGRVNLLCHGVPSSWILMGAIQNAGIAVQWALNGSFGGSERGASRPDLRAIESRLAELEPELSDPIFLPYLTGERTPHMDDRSAGVLFGVRPQHNRFHVLRAVYEGVAFALHECSLVLSELGSSIENLRVCGGVAGGETLLKILASTVGKPVSPAAHLDASAYGAALWARAGAEGDLAVAHAPTGGRAGDSVMPDPAKQDFYRKRFHLFQTIYKDLKPSFALLAEQAAGQD
jgi:xylulokinase